MRKTLGALLVATAVATTFVPSPSAAPDEPERVPSQISIYASADGVFGWVTSRVLVCMEDKYRGVSLAHLAGDEEWQRWHSYPNVGVVGPTKTGMAWWKHTSDRGYFQASVDAASVRDRRTYKEYFCDFASSEIQTRGLLQGSNDIPLCPDATDMCRVPRFRVFVRWRDDDGCRDFDSRIGWHCTGEMLTDGHPFADRGGTVDLTWVKTRKSRYLALEAVSGETWTARLAGRVVRRGWLIDRGEYPSRPLCAYRTPVLPGLSGGEAGGPLAFHYKEKDGGVYITVEGYLYLTDHEPVQNAPCLDTSASVRP